MATETGTAATLTLKGRLLRARGVWIYFALLAAAPLFVTRAVVETRAWMFEPSLNLTTLADGTLLTTSGYWPDARDGDHVVAINGVPVATRADIAAVESTLSIGPATVRFSRDGATYELVGITEVPPLALQLALAARCFTGIALLLIGAIVFVMRAGARIAWLFTLVCFAASGVLLGILALHRDLLWRNLVPYSLMAIACGLGIHFYAEFPLRAAWLARRPRLWVLPHLPGLVLAPVLAFGILTLNETAMGALVGITLWTAVATVLMLVLLGVQRRAAASDVAARARMRALILATSVGLGGPATLMLSWQLGLTEFAGIAHFATVPLLFYTGVIGYTLVRHNAFEVDRFTSGIVGYGVALALLGACFALALIGLPLVLVRTGIPRSPELYVVLTALAFGGFLPLFRIAKSRVDRWFQRSSVDAGRQAEVLRELGSITQTSTRERSLEAALHAAMTLGPDRAELWSLEDGGGHAFKRVASEGEGRGELPPALSRHSQFGRALAGSDAPRGVKGLAPDALPAEAQEELWERKLVLAVGVKAHGGLFGFLGVGRKLSGAAYETAESSFLATIATQAGMAIERATHESARLGRYRLAKRLGTGGMAEVFLAWQLGPGGFERKVALKRPLPHLVEDGGSVAMFLDEARISAQLQHRNIAAIHEVDRQDGHYFIAMEYIDGPSLRAAIRSATDSAQPVPLPVAARIAVGVLDALSYAHAATDGAGKPLELVHRDVTPANVLLTTRGEVKLVDFGIARAAERKTATQTGGVKGTLPYMSPEQAGGRSLDARADLYAAGATLYELFTLSRAFPRGPDEGGAGPASFRRPDLPPPLDPFFERALAADREKRPPSAEVMKRELLTALAGAIGEEEEVARWLATLSFEPRPPPVASLDAETLSLKKRA